MSGELSLRKHNNQKFNLFFPDNFFLSINLYEVIHVFLYIPSGQNDSQI
jgi:hypothetical protein